ncbi:TonB-dependent receptor [Bacteroides fragilis]|uniref:TonB-dependent receptor n=1 Tax=Bacteroides fragilis TaxID=817 RepID=UPI00202F6CB9|nr:TonB-dependent receptor [Bacteroides fragilis]MCM0295224.1 TonB-dependent receptor [Bacteroides fragilis]
MKKKCFYSGMTYLFCHFGANLLLVRTQILLFFFVFLLPLSGVASPLQEIRITIQQKNVPLSKVFKEIEEKTDCSFLIRNNDVNTNEKVSIDAKNKTVAEILGILFDGKGIKYEVNGKRISVYKAVRQHTIGGKRKVTGQVTDNMEEAVIGASVFVMGASNGTITDMNGHFSLELPDDNAKLQVSYIGYKTQVINVGNKSSVNIVLVEDSKALEEVVVVGYGTQKKANLSGSVTQVSTKMLADRPIQNVSTALQGLMPGVAITSSGGRPGMDGGAITVRGIGTLNSASPYILVDGVETGTMNSIDPNDIESISVLKDAASAAIYGSKAANGVILITTKRGNTQKTTVSYSGNVGLSNPTEVVNRLSSYDYARLLNQSMIDAGVNPRFSDVEIRKFKEGADPEYPNTDWYDLILRTGVQHKHNVNVNGGNEKVKYMASLGYMGQEGILPNSERKQFNGRTNLDMQLTSKLSARLNMSFIKNNYSDPTSCYGGGSSLIFRMANRVAPWIVGRYGDGTYGTVSDGNAVAWLDLDQTVDRNNKNFTGTAELNYEIVKGLTATISGSYVADHQRYHEFVKYIRYNDYKESDPNHLTVANFAWERQTFDALLNYDKQFGKHGLKAMAGWHAEKYDYTHDESFRKNFPTNDLNDMNAGEAKTQTNKGYSRELAMLSYFARINYDYAGKYLLEANVRADASSRFAPGNRWGYFPSFSGAWRISEESFMEGARSWLNNLKLRTSWGELGNQDALGDYYPWLMTYNLGTSYPLDGELNSGYSLGSYKSPTISWEKTRTWGVALEATLVNHINASVEYYDKKTTGIIMDMPVPNEFALGGYKTNIGAMRNRGVEVTLGYNNTWRDWSFSASGNFTFNKNELLDLGGVEQQITGNTCRKIGEPLNNYYMYVADGFFQSDEEAQAWMDQYAGKPGFPFGSNKFKGGDLIYQDTNHDGSITPDDRALCGSSNPKFTYGLNLTSRYKDIDLSLIFTGAAGGYALLSMEDYGSFIGDTSSPASVWLDAWTPENKNATMPRVAYNTTSPSHYRNVVSDFWLENTSYVRLKNLQVGYTFPKKWLDALGIQNIRMYYSVENLFTIDNIRLDVDPENPYSDYPLLRTHSFGVNLTF